MLFQSREIIILDSSRWIMKKIYMTAQAALLVLYYSIMLSSWWSKHNNFLQILLNFMAHTRMFLWYIWNVTMSLHQIWAPQLAVSRRFLNVGNCSRQSYVPALDWQAIFASISTQNCHRRQWECIAAYPQRRFAGYRYSRWFMAHSQSWTSGNNVHIQTVLWHKNLKNMFEDSMQS